MTGAAPTQRFEFAPTPGERVVGDHLPGRGPAYLFLHGMGSVRAGEKSTSLFAHAAATGRAALRFDFRGHGESSGELGAVTIGELIADTVQVLERHGPCAVVGSSLGGLVGAFAAAARPELVTGLALLAPALGFVVRLGQRVDAAGRVTTVEGRSFVLRPHVITEAQRHDERALPGRVRAPTLLVHGTADEVVPHALGETFFRHLAAPRKELWLVPGGNHRLNVEAPLVWPRFDALLAGPA